MISKKIENALNKQIEIEAESSQFYLAMASWSEANGLSGTAAFLYAHSDEERLRWGNYSRSHPADDLRRALARRYGVCAWLHESGRIHAGA